VHCSKHKLEWGYKASCSRITVVQPCSQVVYGKYDFYKKAKHDPCSPIRMVQVGTLSPSCHKALVSEFSPRVSSPKVTWARLLVLFVYREFFTLYELLWPSLALSISRQSVFCMNCRNTHENFPYIIALQVYAGTKANRQKRSLSRLNYNL